ncbi:MAG: PD-(D/E)XK nuclease-like domain-containing protein, partial [Patescibacteria group bacterium]|nr:PD-(D/E)XK nuclease-like domain-containing protein [Patescibacteria group bacterium]
TSPAHFKQALECPEKATAPMMFGRIGHQLLLTPKAKPFWAVKPDDFDGRTPAGKAWKAKYADRYWISKPVWNDVLNSVASLQLNPVFSEALKNAKREVACFSMFKSGKRKVQRKGRIDLVTPGISLCDIKFVDDVRERSFRNLLEDKKYYVQAAYYIDLWNETNPKSPKSEFVFFCVEKSAPYPVAIYMLDHEDIAEGRKEYKRLLTMYAECLTAGQWPLYKHGGEYTTEVKTIRRPRWTMKPQSGEPIIQ